MHQSSDLKFAKKGSDLKWSMKICEKKRWLWFRFDEDGKQEQGRTRKTDT
jgi:hypothetical protein